MDMDLNHSKKWIIGVCAMDTKGINEAFANHISALGGYLNIMFAISRARSKPMSAILDRLIQTGDFEIVIFGDKVIFDEPIEHWPICDFLISFFSIGFPLEKAIDYVHLRKPICLNDLSMQMLLWDRRLVLSLLDAAGVPTPRRVCTWHKDILPNLPPEVKNKADKLDVHIDRLESMVRDPVMIDSDSIKVGDTILKKPFVEKPVSGEDHNIFIYYDKASGGGVRKLFRKKGNKSSEFFPDEYQIRHNGTDSYIYEEFMSVDNSEDVKVYTVGQEYAHAETRKSPVVDGVVKRNAEGKEVRYVTELTAQEKIIARRVTQVFGQTVCGFDLLRANGRSYVIDVNGWSFVKGNQDYYDASAKIIHQIFMREIRKRGSKLIKQVPSSENQWKLKAFLSVMRHGDRTPKQKVKFSFEASVFRDLLGDTDEEIVLKKEEQFLLVRECIQKALDSKTMTESEASLDQILKILEAKGKLAGTKVQLRPLMGRSSSLNVHSTSSLYTGNSCRMVQIIIKWGGLFTHGGFYHSQELGKNLRTDLNIINKSLIQDIQVLSSSERRVIDTAETLCSSLLQTTIDPEFILVTKEMLDDSNDAKEQTDYVKQKLQYILNPEMKAVPPREFVMPYGWSDFSQPVQNLIDLLKSVRLKMNENLKIEKESSWCCYETPFLFKERWEKLFRDFCDVERSKFEPSKISELYDALKFDLLHNREYLSHAFHSDDGKNMTAVLWEKSKALFDIIGPHEYGIDDKEKLEIGFKNTQQLLKHLTDQLQAAQESPQPLTRLYFTKESKVYSLLNVVLLCGLKTKVIPTDIAELDYLTQITFELYERSAGSPEGVAEFSLRIGFSPGAHDPNLIELQLDSKDSMSVQPRKWLTDHLPLDEAIKLLKPADAFK